MPYNHLVNNNNSNKKKEEGFAHFGNNSIFSEILKSEGGGNIHILIGIFDLLQFKEEELRFYFILKKKDLNFPAPPVLVINHHSHAEPAGCTGS